MKNQKIMLALLILVGTAGNVAYAASANVCDLNANTPPVAQGSVITATNIAGRIRMDNSSGNNWSVWYQNTVVGEEAFALCEETYKDAIIPNAVVTRTCNVDLGSVPTVMYNVTFDIANRHSKASSMRCRSGGVVTTSDGSKLTAMGSWLSNGRGIQY